MKLEAAHRLSASSSIEKLREFASSLSPEQQQYLLIGLPQALGWGWFGQDFQRNLKTPKIVLEGSSEVIAAGMYGATEYQRFIIGMLYIRNIFPPYTKGGKIYRLTAVKDLPRGSTTIFRNEDQYRSLTSWTILPNPIVEQRERPKGTSDIVLSYALHGAKNILFDYLSAYEFIQTLYVDRDFYIKVLAKKDQQLFKNALYVNRRQIEGYSEEKEVAVYMNAGQEIECTWRLIRENVSEVKRRPSSIKF